MPHKRESLMDVMRRRKISKPQLFLPTALFAPRSRHDANRDGIFSKCTYEACARVCICVRVSSQFCCLGRHAIPGHQVSYVCSHEEIFEFGGASRYAPLTNKPLFRKVHGTPLLHKETLGSEGIQKRLFVFVNLVVSEGTWYAYLNQYTLFVRKACHTL